MTTVPMEIDVLQQLVARLTAAAHPQTDRDQFLAFDEVLSDWIQAAEATNQAADFTREARLDPAYSHAQMQYAAMLIDPRKLEKYGITAISPQPADQERWGKVRQLVEVYAADQADTIDRLLVHRARAVTTLQYSISAQNPATWKTSLQQSLHDLNRARSTLRRFIAQAFPLDHRTTQNITVTGDVGIIGKDGTIHHWRTAKPHPSE